MTKRVTVSSVFNKWHDAQRVDQPDMDLEQTRNVQQDAAIVNNHFGSGVVPYSPIQNVIFDSDSLTEAQSGLISSQDFDGTGLSAHLQPTDTVLGNQLEVELADSEVEVAELIRRDVTAIPGVGGRLSLKVLIIGVDFQGNVQYDSFYFYKKEKQVTSKHYARILSIFFNDFLGNKNCSRSLGGRVVIRESASFQLSRDPIMIEQSVQPNLFFRDFKISGFTLGGASVATLYQQLQAGIGSEYSVDALNINTTVKTTRTLALGDVTTKLGQKFRATTNNIQAITLLLAAEKDESAAVADWFDWSGDLVVSIYEIQTTTACPTDIIPELAIEFEPSNSPLAQISINQVELRAAGYVLSDVLQPVDFVFSKTRLGSTSNAVIVPGRYYMITINRSGNASVGNVFTGFGNDWTANARASTFSSGNWVDVPEDDMWFQVWTAAAKVSDGQAYDAGNGMEITKTSQNELGATIDYVLGNQSLSSTGENTLNTGIVQAIRSESVEEQDERTGNNVFSRQQISPSFSFVTAASLAELREAEEPLIIGCAQDANPKTTVNLTGTQDLPGLVIGDVFTIINPDPDLLTTTLVGSNLVPNNTCQSNGFLIYKALYCVDGYGDVNGDGVIDLSDAARASELVGESLSLSTTQDKIVDGYISTLELLRADVDGDGYISANDVSLITQFVNREINGFIAVGTSFNHLEIYVQPSVGRYDGYYDCDGYFRKDGYTQIDPATLSEAEREYYGVVAAPVMQTDSAFTTVPYVPVPYAITPIDFWKSHLLLFSSEARQVLSSFTFADGTSDPDCTNDLTFTCIDRSELTATCDPGRNDIMIPDNLIMRRGQIINADGSSYAIDLEVAHIILNIPQEQIFDESALNIFDVFIKDAGNGKTNKGFDALRFSDCTTVKSDALIRNQVRFGVSIQSFVPNLDGYSTDDGYVIIVDDIIGVSMDHSTGILTLNVRDLDENELFETLVTKIEITVYLKKAGWKNQTLVIDSDKVGSLFS